MKDYNRIPVSYVCYILKIKDKEIYKVGRSNKLKCRLRNLKVSLYEEFCVLHQFEHATHNEAVIHERLLKTINAPNKIRGEWLSGLILP